MTLKNTRGNRKLTDAQASHVKEVPAQTGMSHRRLADLFGVGTCAIKAALKRDETVKLLDFAVPR